MRIAANNEIALHVPDPTAALNFYRDVLGCVVTDPNPKCIALTSGALRLYLVPDPKPTHKTLVPSFDVSDREAAIGELVANGCTIVPIGRTRRPDSICVIHSACCSTSCNAETEQASCAEPAFDATIVVPFARNAAPTDTSANCRV